MSELSREIPLEGVERFYAEEIFDAVAAAGRGEVTVLTADGKPAAAIVPVGLSDIEPAMRMLLGMACDGEPSQP